MKAYQKSHPAPIHAKLRSAKCGEALASLGKQAMEANQHHNPIHIVLYLHTVWHPQHNSARLQLMLALTKQHDQKVECWSLLSTENVSHVTYLRHGVLL